MDHQSILDKGQELYTEGRVGEAQTVFEYILEIQPDSVPALNNLGVVAFQRGDQQAAIEFFTRALDIRADDADTLLNLADLYLKTQRWPRACEYLETCARHHPTESLFKLLANVHSKIGNGSKAADYLKKSYEYRQMGSQVVETNISPSRPPVEKNERCQTPLQILFVQDSPCIRNYKMASALRSRGHHVALAYTGKRLSERYPGLSDDTYNECVCLVDHRHLWDLSRNYDLVHCHNEPDMLTVAALAGSAPVVHDTHDLISLRSDGDPKLAYFEGIANRGTAGRIYTTPYQLEEARKLYGVNGSSLVFYNYCAAADLPKRFLPKLSENDCRTHIVYEGGVGGSAHRDFSDVFTQLAVSDVDVHIYPATYDPKQARAFSGYPQIHYNQPVSPKKLMEEMSQYDFGIIPFNLEKGNKRFLDSTIANKLFEYLAAGLPVMASALNSYIDFFKRHPVGFTYELVEEIIERIPQLKTVAKQVDFTKYVYTFEKEIRSLEKFYFGILDSHGIKWCN